ncbi:MAG: rhodanese-like domain-containing protein [Desulfobacterales bacterium]|nr:rhodanese-like domain-containing protein [Desulfobacterales bacterium]
MVFGITGKDITGCLLLLVFSTALGLGVNHFSPAGIALFGQWDTSAGVVMAGAAREDAIKAPELNNPMKVLRMVSDGKTVFVDVRRADIYREGHIPGALSFPLHDFDAIIAEFTGSVAKTDPILVYCSGVTCTDSHEFAARIIGMGYSQVTVYSGGFTEWSEMEFEVATDAG